MNTISNKTFYHLKTRSVRGVENKLSYLKSDLYMFYIFKQQLINHNLSLKKLNKNKSSKQKYLYQSKEFNYILIKM